MKKGFHKAYKLGIEFTRRLLRRIGGNLFEKRCTRFVQVSYLWWYRQQTIWLSPVLFFSLFAISSVIVPLVPQDWFNMRNMGQVKVALLIPRPLMGLAKVSDAWTWEMIRKGKMIIFRV
ncbi:hypothetical protein Btru_074275 [Bulinus truncatus]|nr:hypothetical protein Btru_074275 [Bulinus truncatus]